MKGLKDLKIAVVGTSYISLFIRCGNHADPTKVGMMTAVIVI